MSSTLDLLDVVELSEDLPERGLRRGQIGTVVEFLASEVYEVEFADDNGRTQAIMALRAEQLVPHQGAGRQRESGYHEELVSRD